MQLVVKNNSQFGAALIMIIFVLGILATGYLLQRNNPTDMKLEREKKTNLSLSQAKQALLAFSAQPITNPPNTTPDASMTCNLNCPRPGDLPCPDTNNDGEAQANCSAQNERLGRLPWKTLGIEDLRDGSGERLWYAVSNRYKNNPRILPLNSDTVGTISYRNNLGSWIYDASVSNGLAAVVIAPKGALTRADNIAQDRTVANENIANNYLDVAFGEDNASFFDGTSDGFISGKILAGGREVVNDVVLPITQSEMNTAMEPRVLSEVMQALLYGFCPGRNNNKTRTCMEPKINDYLPDPAKIEDKTCLGNADIATSSCITDATRMLGRIAVGGNTSRTGSGGWKNQDSNSLLSGDSTNNWFQQNSWRELIFYARATACAETDKNCTGSGYLTLHNALVPSLNNKQVVLISAGNILSGQVRSNDIDKTLYVNYLEDENLLPLDNLFLRYIPSAIRNDRATSIP